MSAYPPYGNLNARDPSAIAEFLEKNFPPEPIQPGQSEMEAHRRAGQVDVAQRLAATIRRMEDS